MSLEQLQGRPNYWPFKEPLDEREVTRMARKIHRSGKTWSSSIAKALSFTRAVTFFKEPEFDPNSANYSPDIENRTNAEVAYSMMLIFLGDLEKPEEVLRLSNNLIRPDLHSEISPQVIGHWQAFEDYQKIFGKVIRK